ncbi:unnamed protein product [Rotaria sp. Silwood2]|nr:unnamed protein product [Rotaria sp. Silwood2]
MLLEMAKYNLNAIYTIITINDEQNSSIYVIGVGQGSLGLAQPESYANENALTKSYQQWMKDLAMTMTNVTSMIDDDVTSIFELEKKIAEFSWTIAEQIARQKDNVRTTVSNLSNTINSSIDFSNYLRRVYQSVNVTLNDTERVIVGELEYLKNVSNVISQYSSRTLQNYFIWRFMMTLIDYMPKRFRTTKQQFTQTLDGSASEEKRTLTCSSNVNSLMGFALSRLYIRKYFDENARNESLIMIENIRNTFIEMINQSNWMDSVSKTKAMAKARAIVENVSYPDYVASDNVTKLEKDYADYKFNSSYILNGLKIAHLAAKDNYRLLRQSVDRQTWTFPPTKIEAAYNPSLNSICIGSTMGHEITHGFDIMGRQYDQNGNIVPWWANETIDAYNKQTECFIQQYSNYTVPSVNRQVDGVLTVSENLADNGGLKEAFFVMVFYCLIDNEIMMFYEKPMDCFRVIGSTSNFVEFDRVFSCKPGQSNSRLNKCTLW